GRPTSHPHTAQMPTTEHHLNPIRTRNHPVFLITPTQSPTLLPKPKKASHLLSRRCVQKLPNLPAHSTKDRRTTMVPRPASTMSSSNSKKCGHPAQYACLPTKVVAAKSPAWPKAS